MKDQAEKLIELTFTGITTILDRNYMTFKKDDNLTYLAMLRIPTNTNDKVVVIRDNSFYFENATNDNYHLAIGVVKMKMVNVLK